MQHKHTEVKVPKPGSSTATDAKIILPESLEYFDRIDYNLMCVGKEYEHPLFLDQFERRMTVKYIINEYTKSKSPTDVMCGLESYFEKSLGTFLLYERENPQYDQAVKRKVPLVEQYGAYHLLRLFVRLNSLLSQISLDEQSEVALVQGARDFLQYLAKNRHKYFYTDFVIVLDP